MKRNMIQGLVSKGQYKEALSLFTQVHSSCFQPNNFTFPFLLKACSSLQLIPQTQQVHSHIIKSGFQTCIFTATALINTYMKLCLPEDALKVFGTIPDPTLPSLNAVISGFSKCGQPEESLYAFRCLHLAGLSPNSVTVAGVLPACRTLEHGSQIHGLSIKLGHESDVYVATALITMYSNCRELGSAQRVFKMITGKSIVSFNAMASGFMQNGRYSMALELFKEVIGFSKERPSSSTLLSLLSICSKISASSLGKEIHCYILKREGGSDVMIGSALVDMYSKCGLLTRAYQVFTAMENRNLVTWNTMISGLLSKGCLDIALALFYKLRSEGLKPDSATWNTMINGFSRHGNEAEAFRLFTEMQLAGIRPSLKVLTSLLQACSSISNLQHGKEIHCHVIRIEASHEDEFLDTALIHMYMNCGFPAHARRIFDQSERKSEDPALWNALISGYGRNGENEFAIEIFREMQERGLKPNSATFLSVLSVCGHTGQVERGWEFFRMMSRDYGIQPTEEHYGSMVDVLSRAGDLDEAWDLINEMPEPSASACHSLLGGCRCHLDTELGEMVAQRLSELEPRSPASLVVLAGIYAQQGRWIDAQKLRKVISDRRLIKVRGRSWVEVKELQVDEAN